jgi:hypothetical protein
VGFGLLWTAVDVLSPSTWLARWTVADEAPTEPVSLPA